MGIPAIQEWAADRGWCQYPLPRSRRRRPRPDHIGLRLVVGVLGLFGVIVIGAIVLAMIFVASVFIHGALTG